MAKKLNLTPKYEETLIENTLKFISKLNRPCYIGEIANELNVSIEIAEYCSNKLISKNVLKKATEDEIKRRGGKPTHAVVSIA